MILEPTEAIEKRLSTGAELLRQRVISPSQLELCLDAQRGINSATMGSAPKIGEIILDYGFSTRSAVENAIAISGGESNGLGSSSFPLKLLKRVKAYPVSLKDGILRMASAGALDLIDKEDILAVASSAGLIVDSIELEPKNRIDVLSYINKLSAPDKATVSAELMLLNERADDHLFINQIIQNVYVDALESRASDIHLMVSDIPNYSWIVHRIDGELRYTYMVPVKAMSVLATRIKMDAKLDYTDTMRPHDGRSSFRSNGKQIDLRISTLPVDYGESIVLRILDSSNVPNISNLFEDHPIVLHHITQIIASNQKAGGVVLVTGATGSGKSTTLNAILRGMDRSKKSIKTVEDPVELKIPLVGHTQVNEAAGLTYANALRALLRQDPDVIMVGELRDYSTIETALRAAETGHLMLSTLHTGSVDQSYTRAVGMMNEDFRPIGKYIISNSLKAIVNQKLAKRLCSKCSRISKLDEKIHSILKTTIGENNLPTHFYESKGCERCNGTGYYGRILIPEALFVDSSYKTRTEVEKILISGKSFKEIFSIEGVVWYPRELACASVLKKGIIDVVTVLSVLDILHIETDRRKENKGDEDIKVKRRASDQVNQLIQKNSKDSKDRVWVERGK